MNRREALRRMALGGLGAATPMWVDRLVAVAHAHVHEAPMAAAGAAADWTPRVLTAHQNELVVSLSELIIPQTDTPGARAALVNRFVDAVLDDADDPDRKSFLRGLDWVDARSQELFGGDFVAASPEQQTALLTILSSGQDKALEDQLGLELFRAVKSLTITGYYTSEVGMKQELKDDGTLFFAELTGCTHPEHGGAAPTSARTPRKS